MKKYLVTGLAAVAISGMFTSCTHENDTAGGSSDLGVVETYEKAFISRFGTPSPDADWGFGSSTANTRALTRAMNISFDYWEFPDDANANKFLADVPEGVEKLTQNAASVNGWIDETWEGELNIWGAWDGTKNSGGTIYLKGNLDFTNRKFYIAPNTEVYLLEGTTLTLRADDTGNLQSGCNFYMAANSKIVAKGELKLNNGLHIYNHGTIEAPKLSTNSNSVLYNVGTVTIAGKISVENDLSAIVNDGTITAADLNTAGSGKFENNGNTTITGTTFVNSNNNTWVNNGQYRTGNFIYNAASDEVINNCRLTVDEDFNINLGDNPGNGNFKMNSNSGVVTKYFNGGGNWAKNYSTGWSAFNGGPFYIYMGSNSVFKVTETATMNATKADYGVYGVGNDFAVFSAKKIEAGAANQGYEVTYGGNLYVYAENGHFANGFSGSYPYIDIKDNAKIYASGFEDGKPAVNIEETPCNPGFGDNPSETVIRVIAEDMGDQSLKEASDFDFNDVVFDVTWVSESKVKIKILAAGGTLPLTVGWDGTEDPNDPKAYIKHEVHYMLGYSESTMINTHSTVGNHIDGVAPYEFEFTGTFSKDNFAANVRDNIPVKVRKNGVWYDINAEQGRAPGKIAVGTDYNPWCNERVDIDDWWQNNNIQGLFYLYTQSPATLTKFWYKQATYRNGEPISK